MALGVDIISAFDGKGIKEAIEEFKKLETNGQKAQFAIQKAALPAAAALAGLAAAAGLSVKAAIEDQQEQAKLAQTLSQVTGASKETVAANEEYLASLSRTTIFSDSEMRPALANLVQASGDLARSQEDLKLAMDISVATGVPLVQVTDALGKAYNGNMKSLQALSPALKDNIKEGQNLDQVFTELNATFGGATAAATNTAAGQMTMLKNQLGELSESFGTALLPIVQAIVPVFSAMANFAENNRTAFLALAGVVAVVSSAIVAAAGVIKVFNIYQRVMEIDTIKSTLAFKDAAGEMTAFGQAVVGVGKVLAVVALAETIFAIGNAASGADRKIQEATNNIIINISKLAQNSGTDTQQVVEDFAQLAAEIGSKLKMSDVFGDFGREFQLTMGGVKVDIEDFDEAFKKTMDTSPEAAQKLIDALKAQLAITDPTSRAYKDLSDAIARYEGQLVQTKTAQDALNRGFAQTLTLADVVRNTINTVTQAKFDDMRMNNANADSLKQYQTQVLGMKIGTSGAAKEVKTATEKLADYTAALRGNYDAQRSMTAATNGRISAEKALGAASDAVRKAQEQFNNVVKGYPKDSKIAVEANRRYEESQRRLRDANIAQRDAVLELKDAEEDLRKLREIKADPEGVADAERELERSKYAVEEANFGVIEAEAALAELRADPNASAIEVRRAEIALAEAKLRVTESVNAVKDAEVTLSKEINRKATAEEIADAERRLARAKLGVEDATYGVREATIQQSESQEYLNRILKGATEDTEEYKDALRDLNNAKQEEEDARLRVAQAILAEAEAIIALAEANRKLAEVAATTPARIVSQGTQALAGISTDNAALQALNTVTGQQPSGTTNMNVTVNAGMGTDGQTVAREIIDVLKQYERANGYIPIVAEYSAYV